MKIKSRLGREKQRYQDKYRLCAGGVPYKNNQILLITSRKHTNNWGLPKGGWEIDETVEEAAKREIGEETGCIVELTTLIGEFQFEEGEHYNNQIWSMYLAKYSGEYESWDEESERKRQWIDIDSAISLCERPQMKQILQKTKEVMIQQKLI